MTRPASTASTAVSPTRSPNRIRTGRYVLEINIFSYFLRFYLLFSSFSSFFLLLFFFSSFFLLFFLIFFLFFSYFVLILFLFCSYFVLILFLFFSTLFLILLFYEGVDVQERRRLQVRRLLRLRPLRQGAQDRDDQSAASGLLRKTRYKMNKSFHPVKRMIRSIVSDPGGSVSLSRIRIHLRKR